MRDAAVEVYDRVAASNGPRPRRRRSVRARSLRSAALATSAGHGHQSDIEYLRRAGLGPAAQGLAHQFQHHGTFNVCFVAMSSSSSASRLSAGKAVRYSAASTLFRSPSSAYFATAASFFASERSFDPEAGDCEGADGRR